MLFAPIQIVWNSMQNEILGGEQVEEEQYEKSFPVDKVRDKLWILLRLAISIGFY